MSGNSKIEWTDATWNPVRGCSRVSEGCRHCYAERVAARFSGPGKPYEGLAVMKSDGPHWTGKVRLVEEALDLPLHWKKPRRIFVNSMSDLFHEGLPFEAVKSVWDVIAECRQHIFQILTKRPERLLAFHRWLAGPDDISITEWPQNAWLGVSVENQATADERIPLLLQAPAAVRWISAEPLLGPIDVGRFLSRCPDCAGGTQCSGRLHGALIHLNWVVVGGESGPGARPMRVEWAESIVEQCKAAGVPVFVKQLGRFPEKGIENAPLRMMRLGLKDKKGGDPAEWPAHLRIREYPARVRVVDWK